MSEHNWIKITENELFKKKLPKSLTTTHRVVSSLFQNSGIWLHLQDTEKQHSSYLHKTCILWDKALTEISASYQCTCHHTSFSGEHYFNLILMRLTIKFFYYITSATKCQNTCIKYLLCNQQQLPMLLSGHLWSAHILHMTWREQDHLGHDHSSEALESLLNS